MPQVWDVVAFLGGLAVVIGMVGSAMRTVVLPRGVSIRVGRVVFIGLRLLFKVVIRRSTSYERRDRVLAVYAPLALLGLLATWLLGLLAGFTAMFWGVGITPVRRAFAMSGSSMLTLGFAAPHDLPATVMAFIEAGLGLLLLALMITFLPTIYDTFHDRELEVSRLEVYASSPPSGAAMLVRLFELGRLDYRTDIWLQWQTWFIGIEDSHTSFPALPFFRSPQPDHSWITAAGAVLDGAALSASCLDLPRDIEAEFCVRSGYVALRRIATLFRLPFDADPSPTDAIAVDRQEFDEVWDKMAAQGLPLKPDRSAAWQDFVGWRVNYETPLIRLAMLTEAPIAPWSSDRGLMGDRPLTFIERIRQ